MIQEQPRPIIVNVQNIDDGEKEKEREREIRLASNFFFKTS
jgi:hypothetical protein